MHLFCNFLTCQTARCHWIAFEIFGVLAQRWIWYDFCQPWFFRPDKERISREFPPTGFARAQFFECVKLSWKTLRLEARSCCWCFAVDKLKSLEYFGMPLSFCLSVLIVVLLACLSWSALLCFVLSPSAEVFSVRSFSPWLRLEKSSEAAFQASLNTLRTCRERIPDIQGKVVLCDAWRSVKCDNIFCKPEPRNLSTCSF